jgi:hypothetical protein
MARPTEAPTVPSQATIPAEAQLPEPMDLPDMPELGSAPEFSPLNLPAAGEADAGVGMAMEVVPDFIFDIG